MCFALILSGGVIALAAMAAFWVVSNSKTYPMSGGQVLYLSRSNTPVFEDVQKFDLDRVQSGDWKIAYNRSRNLVAVLRADESQTLLRVYKEGSLLARARLLSGSTPRAVAFSRTGRKVAVYVTGYHQPSMLSCFDVSGSGNLTQNGTLSVVNDIPSALLAFSSDDAILLTSIEASDPQTILVRASMRSLSPLPAVPGTQEPCGFAGSELLLLHSQLVHGLVHAVSFSRWNLTDGRMTLERRFDLPPCAWLAIHSADERSIVLRAARSDFLSVGSHFLMFRYDIDHRSLFRLPELTAGAVVVTAQSGSQ